MIKQSSFESIAELQMDRLQKSDKGYQRDLLTLLNLNLPNHALIITGIRRCGKSTLLRQLIDRVSEKVFFLNFDTPGLFNFEIDDFELVDKIGRASCWVRV